MWSLKFLFINDHLLFMAAWRLSQHTGTKKAYIQKKKPSGKSVFEFWHLWCIIAVVMMQIKFNSLFYKLADAVWQSKAASLRRGAPGVLAGQCCC